MTHLVKVQGRMREDATEHYQSLKDTLLVLNKPIVHISDQMSIIQDNLNSQSPSTLNSCLYLPIVLIPCQEKSGREFSDGCPKSSTEAIMMISPKTC